MDINQLAELFKRHSISTVAIIDDAYLEHPTLADLRPMDGQKALWGAIDASDEVLTFLRQNGIELVAPEDVGEQQIEKLYELRSHNGALSAILNQFDHIQIQKRERLKALKDLLAELGHVPLEMKPSDSLSPDALPDLIFLDYFLDPSGFESSLPLAKSVGQNIRETFGQRQKPYVVLLSNVSDIKAENRSLFRDTADIVGGMFHFVPKAELQEHDTVILRLALMLRSITEGRKIQQFVEKYDQTIHTIAEDFRKTIRALSLEDYAYIQKMSLQGEGQPLGDYSLWLFGMYFSHLLGRSNPEGRTLLDGMVFSYIPDSLGPPSPDFVTFYQSVVSEPVDELGTHPRLSEEERARLGDKVPPDPHFGDLFFGPDGAVLMIATAECDLAYAPEPGSGRQFEPDQPGLLIRGDLDPEANSPDSDAFTTDYVEVDGKNQRIVWSLKKFKTLEAGSLRNLAQDQFKRQRRLRMPFSHKVQQALTNDIERIGVPVAPPIVRTAGLDILYQAADGGHRRVPGPKDGVTISMNIQSGLTYYQLRHSAVVAIVKECPNAIGELEKLRDADGVKRQVFERYITALESFMASLESQVGLAESFSLNVEHQIRNAPIKVLSTVTQDDLKNWRAKQPIVVVITEEKTKDPE